MATISVKRQPVGSQVKLTVIMTVDTTDPLAANVYGGIEALLDQIMSPEGVRIFWEKLNAVRRNPKGGEVSGRIKAA